MTTAASMTYDSLVADLPSYLERKTDTAFAAKIPSFIMLAENRIAADLKQQGFVSVVKGNLVPGIGGASMSKPAFWRESISFTYRDPLTGWQPMRLRSLEYVKNYWPMQASTGAPRFYADYNAQNFYVAPSPDQGYPFELSYYARLQPLDSANQTNWLTLNAPQALLAACVVEAYLWAKNTGKAAEWDAIYNDRKGSLIQENQERLTDRTEAVTRA